MPTVHGRPSRTITDARKRQPRCGRWRTRSTSCWAQQNSSGRPNSAAPRSLPLYSYTIPTSFLRRAIGTIFMKPTPLVLVMLVTLAVLAVSGTAIVQRTGADDRRGGSYDIAVVEQGAGRVTLLDGASGARRGSVTVGKDPHEIAVSDDGRFAYVSNFGLSDKDRAVGVPGESVSMVDLTTFREVRRLETKPYKAPHGVKIRPGTEDQIYVNAEEGDVMLVFQGSSGKLLHQFAVPRDTHNFVFSSTGKELFLMA